MVEIKNNSQKMKLQTKSIDVQCDNIFMGLLFLATKLIEFFRFEFYGIYRICKKLFLVVLKMKITKNSLIQILLNSVEY